MSQALEMMKDKRKVTCAVEYFSHFETKFEQNKKWCDIFSIGSSWWEQAEDDATSCVKHKPYFDSF